VAPPGLLPHLPGLTRSALAAHLYHPAAWRAAVEQLFAGVAAVAQPLG
jgi:hypothetical protein